MVDPQPISPDRVAVYIRWSTDEQGDGTTLGTQLETCKHYLLSQGWAFRQDLVFIDDGYSGSSMDRPALSALRESVQKGYVDCVITYKLDRLSRSLLDTVQLVLQEWDGRCYYKSAREPIDTTTPTGRMFFYILASYAEWERSLIFERLFSGKRARARQGKNPGVKPPYGYRLGTEPGSFVVYQPEAIVVQRIFNDYVRGKSARTIAEELTAAGVPTREGGPWIQNTILWILRNEAYCGVLVWGKTTRVRNGRESTIKKHDQPKYARVEGALPPIVDAETWRQAQAILEQRGTTRQRRSEFLLSGIARCQCGGALVGSTVSVKYRYYYCARARQAGTAACNGSAIPCLELEERIAAIVKSHFESTNRDGYLEHLVEEIAAEKAGLKTALDGITDALRELERKSVRVQADYEAGELPARLYAKHMDEYDAERLRLGNREQAVRAELDRLTRRQSDLQSLEQEFDAITERVSDWDYLTIEEKKQTLRHVVERMVVWRPPVPRGAPIPAEVDLVLRRAPEASTVAPAGIGM